MEEKQHPLDKIETIAHNCYDKAIALKDSLRAIGKEEEPDQISISTFFGLSRFAGELADQIDQIESFLSDLRQEEKKGGADGR
jgi:hypothetical protein